MSNPFQVGDRVVITSQRYRHTAIYRREAVISRVFQGVPWCSDCEIDFGAPFPGPQDSRFYFADFDDLSFVPQKKMTISVTAKDFQSLIQNNSP